MHSQSRLNRHQWLKAPGPQVGSMESVHLHAYTRQVLLQNGTATRISAKPNFN